MQTIARRFWAVEGPTWLVAAAIYGLWTPLIAYHQLIPWWIEMPVGAYLVGWHFSLQHETIHGFRAVPAWFRFAVAFPPLGLWFPYSLYCESHNRHHRNTYLTVPGEDPETYYVRREEWERMGRIRRGILLLNQTLAGRLLIGGVLRLKELAAEEIARARRADISHLPHWAIHAVAVGGVLWFVAGICGMPVWEYALLIAYPGFSLTLLRAFIEHRAGRRPGERIASVESNPVFGLLFLYNNLHIAHHLNPTMPWYELPRFYRQNREKLLRHNGHFVFRGYGDIARRWLIKPVFVPVHPTRLVGEI